jgi:hypothetical protein
METKRAELLHAYHSVNEARAALDTAHDLTIPDDAYAAHNAVDDAREALGDVEEALARAARALYRYEHQRDRVS